MEKIIRVTILRENPVSGTGPYPEVYDVPADRDMTILEILHEIYFHLDSTLAYRRYRCGRRICRSCEIKLDGKIVRGCATLLRPGKTYLLEAAHSTALIRDLVFEFDK